MAIEIVDLPIENGDFPWFFVSFPEGRYAYGTYEKQCQPEVNPR